MKKILFALLAVVAVGLLLKPEKTSETLKKITDAFDDFKYNTINDLNSLIDKSKRRIV
jgi:hypothetical protein